MPDLQIKRSDGVEEFEKHLQKKSTFQNNLLIPNDLEDGGGIGTAVAFCQFLLTWARRSKFCLIKTFLNAGDEPTHERFTDRVHGIFAAYVAEKLIGNRNEGRGVNIRNQVLKAAKPRIEAMSRGDLGKSGRGPEIEFVFVQGARNEFHGSFYSKVPTSVELLDRQKHGELIRSHRELSRLLERCFEHLNIRAHIDRQLPSRDLIFGVLISELFRNTAEHGYLSIDGAGLDFNLRCVRVAATLISRDKLASKSVSSPAARTAAQEYFNRMAGLKSEYNRSKIRVLELSVFDSGPGFAATIEGCEISEDEVIRLAVARCFIKHQSAKLAPNGGLGLFKVIELLKELGGFLRVRTASVEVFYGGSPDSDPEIDPEAFVYGGLTPVEGSVVTIGIPITY